MLCTFVLDIERQSLAKKLESGTGELDRVSILAGSGKPEQSTSGDLLRYLLKFKMRIKAHNRTLTRSLLSMGGIMGLCILYGLFSSTWFFILPEHQSIGICPVIWSHPSSRYSGLNHPFLSFKMPPLHFHPLIWGFVLSLPLFGSCLFSTR